MKEHKGQSSQRDENYRHEGIIEESDGQIRPRQFNDFAGQEKILKNLRVYVLAAKERGEP